jgi:hypothetical protein
MGTFPNYRLASGESITLEKNDYNFRASEGYPAVDKINIKFIKEDRALNDLLDKRVVMVDSSLITKEWLARPLHCKRSRLWCRSSYRRELGSTIVRIKPLLMKTGITLMVLTDPYMGDAAVRNAIRSALT